ncbi:oligosaccharide flippase family protein [Providencia sp. JGM172]|uniref:oligosaccharide flippase family protein n=1 Tax=unclassified Providencia TaxID=2633465 RepID=UPI001BAD46F1|nr:MULTISPECIES: oligosaccharide flippase family protein [unclassified Providencia]MBS0934661.1 oligosaccharide flippase family protein [Providencia sp. JGM172]
MNRIYTNILSLTLIQLFNYISPLLALPYLSRTLNIDGFGLLMLSMSIISICLVVSDFGFNLSSTYWIARNREDKIKVSKHIGAVFIIKCLLITLLLITLSFYILEITTLPIKNKENYLLTLSLIIIFQSFQPTWFFQGIERMFNITIFMAFSKLSYVLLIFLFVRRNDDIDVALYCLLASNLVGVILSTISIYLNKYSIKLPSFDDITKTLKNSYTYFLSRASVIIYTSASTFIVGSYSGLYQAALFSSAEKLYQAGQSITSPVSQAIFPHIARTGEKNILYKFIAIILLPLTALCLFCLFFSEDIITIFYGEEYRDASKILNVFIICTVINFLGVNFGYPAFAALNRLDIPNKTTILGCLFQLISLVILYQLNNITAYSVACSILITETIVMLTRIFFFLKLKDLQ